MQSYQAREIYAFCTGVATVDPVPSPPPAPISGKFSGHVCLELCVLHLQLISGYNEVSDAHKFRQNGVYLCSSAVYKLA